MKNVDKKFFLTNIRCLSFQHENSFDSKLATKSRLSSFHLSLILYIFVKILLLVLNLKRMNIIGVIATAARLAA